MQPIKVQQCEVKGPKNASQQQPVRRNFMPSTTINSGKGKVQMQGARTVKVSMRHHQLLGG